MHSNFLSTKSVKNIVITLLPLVALLFGACSGTHHVAKTPLEVPVFEKEQVWQLTTMRGRPADRQSKEITLQFNSEAGSVRGIMACNTYFGHFVCNPGDPETGRHPISITLEGSGSLGCPEADMNAEGRFFAAFQKANNILISDNSLTLYRDNKELLLFELRQKN